MEMMRLPETARPTPTACRWSTLVMSMRWQRLPGLGNCAFPPAAPRPGPPPCGAATQCAHEYSTSGGCVRQLLRRCFAVKASKFVSAGGMERSAWAGTWTPVRDVPRTLASAACMPAAMRADLVATEEPRALPCSSLSGRPHLGLRSLHGALRPRPQHSALATPASTTETACGSGSDAAGGICAFASIQRASSMGCSAAWLALQQPRGAQPLVPSKPQRPPVALQVTRRLELHAHSKPHAGPGSGTPMLYQIAKMHSSFDRLCGLRDREDTSGDESDEDGVVVPARLVYQAQQ